MKPFLITVFALFLGSSVWAIPAMNATEPTETCSDFFKNLGSFRFHRFANTEGKCYMSASPNDTPDYVYRSYLFTSTGSLMVWLSMDQDQYGVSDGSRVFTFFPRNQTPTIEDYPEYVTVKSSTAGFAINLDRKSKKIHSVIGADFKEDPKVYPGNAGGVEFSNVKFLYMDSGYLDFADPTGEPGRSSKFIDTKGKTCTVKNREIFNYDADGDPTLKFTDAQLKTFLAKNCPQLTVNF